MAQGELSASAYRAFVGGADGAAAAPPPSLILAAAARIETYRIATIRGILYPPPRLPPAAVGALRINRPDRTQVCRDASVPAHDA